ncbi:MAG: hypothetical protein J0L78_12850 [Planctomycetes bacterium]|nr:hypothetical protein [Planctomycetota bacterium]
MTAATRSYFTFLAAGTAFGFGALARADAGASLSDGAFNLADWTLSTLVTGDGGPVTVQQVGGGNPGNAVRFDNPPSTFGVSYAMYVLSSASLNPADGAAISFDYSVESKPLGSGVKRQFAFVLEQGGVLYWRDINGNVSPGTWNILDASLVPEDFARVDGLPGSPDFSPAGEPVRFGFAPKYHNATPTTQSELCDNFSVLIHRSSFSTTLADFPDGSIETLFASTDPETETSASIVEDGDHGRVHQIAIVRPASPEDRPSANAHAVSLPPSHSILPSVDAPKVIRMTIDSRDVKRTSPEIEARVAIALEQDGVQYRLATPVVLPISETWTTTVLPPAKNSDFVRVDEQAGKPDFSADAPPIKTGYAVSVSLPPVSAPETGDRFALRDDEGQQIVLNFDNITIRTTNTTCDGDLTFDTYVDDSDFVQFAGAYDIFDCTAPEMAAGCVADINADNFVDDSDFVLFAQAYDLFTCN